jgi:hypothetical protein
MLFCVLFNVELFNYSLLFFNLFLFVILADCTLIIDDVSNESLMNGVFDDLLFFDSIRSL